MGQALLVSTAAGLATGIGALIVLIIGKPSRGMLSLMLGFAAGVMLSIAGFDLIPEAVAAGGRPLAVVGFLLGAGFMMSLDLIIPHIHMGSGSNEKRGSSKPVSEADGDASMLKMGWFIYFGLALHNLPEGLAIGAGYGASQGLGTAIALSLALHNIPEGMASAAPLYMGGMGKLKLFLLTTLAGLLTPVGTLIGQLLFQISPKFICIALAFAAGSMVYIVSDELIPESHSFHCHWANIGLLAGLVVGFLIG